MLIRRTVSTLLCLVTLAMSVAAQDTLTWLYNDFPPYLIAEGDQKGNGAQDQLIRLMQKNMPMHKHASEFQSFARITKELEDGSHACMYSLFRKPEREAIMYFTTVPSFISPPLGITIKRSNLGKFGSSESVSLAVLIKDKNLKLGIAQDRSYSKALDDIIKANSPSDNIYVRGGKDSFKGLFEMLSRDRVDYIIGYPDESMYAAAINGFGKDYINITLKESSTYILGYIAFPKNEWGKKASEEASKVLIKLRPTEEYRKAVEYWLDDNSRLFLRNAYKEIFLKTELPPQ